MKQARWAVAAVVKEPADVMRRFLAWNLAQGAQEIWLFFDDPDDPFIPHAERIDRVRVTRCTTAFWEALGVRENANFVRRQVLAVRRAYDATEADWLLHIDADELIYFPDQNIGAVLAKVDPEIGNVLVRPAEAVRIDGFRDRQAFRMRMTQQQIVEVYGEAGRMLDRSHGLVGHDIGKSFMRTGLRDVRIRNHFLRDKAGDLVRQQILDGADGAYLLHFIARGFRDWRRKLPHRLKFRGYRRLREERLGDLLRANDDRILRDYYRRLHHLTVAQAEYLRARGLLLEPVLDFQQMESVYFSTDA